MDHVEAGQVRQVRCLLSGVGHVGRRLLDLVQIKSDYLRTARRLDLLLVGVADSSGAAACPEGLDLAEILARKRKGLGVAGLPGFGQPGRTTLDLVESVRADLLLEASPPNLRDGQPALRWVEAALERGLHAVLANKAPLVHGYSHLVQLAADHGVQLRFDATVAGGLPVINLGQRDLAGAEITALEGVLNLTTSLVLGGMEERGLSPAQALAEAQAAGHAEADPALDLEGWDAAFKLVILAQSVLGIPARLSDVAVEGISLVTTDMLKQAAARGRRIRLVARAERAGGGYRLSVRPTPLPLSHPLAQLTSQQMGVLFQTDVCGEVSAAITEETPMPTAFAMLRDVLDICACPGAGS